MRLSLLFGIGLMLAGCTSDEAQSGFGEANSLLPIEAGTDVIVEDRYGADTPNRAGTDAESVYEEGGAPRDAVIDEVPDDAASYDAWAGPTCTSDTAPIAGATCATFCQCMRTYCGMTIEECKIECAPFTAARLCCQVYHCLNAAVGSPDIHCGHVRDPANCPE